MKKIYMPSDDILLKMQELGGNINAYLLIKAAESLIVDGINYPNKGMLKSAYKYLRENPDIAHAVCLLYPKEIKYSEVAKYDVSLTSQLISKSTSKDIYTLDNLSYFGESIRDNNPIILNTIGQLDEYLPTNPEYRFEYKDNVILEDIFSTRILDRTKFYNNIIMEKLSNIEPAYAVLFPQVTEYENKYLEETYRKMLLTKGMRTYAIRYCLDGTLRYNKEIDLNNQDEETKRLIRCIKHDKDNLY